MVVIIIRNATFLLFVLRSLPHLISFTVNGLGASPRLGVRALLGGEGAIKKPGPEKANKQSCPRLAQARISLSECIMIGRGLCHKRSCFCLSSRPTNLNISHFSGIILGPGSSTLFIERVTEEDEGVYHCKATNQKGSVESSAYLTVQGKQLLQKATRNCSDIYFPVCLTFHLPASCCPSCLCLSLTSCPLPLSLWGKPV